MNRWLILISILILPLSSISQDLNQDKYWNLRSRLLDNLIVLGEVNSGDYGDLEKGGFSLPAKSSISNSGFDLTGFGLDAATELINWGDGGIHLGQYIAMLATEYELLKRNNKSTNEIKGEIYLALKAFERLDANAEKIYGNTESINGFFIRDDISETLMNDNYWNQSIKSLPNNSFYNCTNELLNNTYKTGDYELNLQLTSNNQTFSMNVPYSECVDNGNIKQVMHFESDMVKRFRDAYSNNVEPSVDQISYLFLGFYLVQKYLNGETYNSPNGIFNFKTKIDGYAGSIFYYLESNQWHIRNPNGVNVHYPLAWIDYIPIKSAYEDITQNVVVPNLTPFKLVGGIIHFLGTLDPGASYDGATFSPWFINSLIDRVNQTMNSNIQHVSSTQIWQVNDHRRTYVEALTSIGNSWEYGIKSRICHSWNINLGLFTITKNWHTYETTPINVSIFVDPDDIINDLIGVGLSVNPLGFTKGCLGPFPLPTLTINKTAKNFNTLANRGKNDSKLFALMHSLNHGVTSGFDPDIPYIQDRINQAPCIGPHNFYPGTLGNVTHWTSHSAWNKDHGTNPPSPDGAHYNGIDYMLLYNTYRLSSNNFSNVPDIEFRNQINYKINSSFPHTPIGYSSLYGTNSNPAYIRAMNTLYTDGNVVIDGYGGVPAKVTFNSKRSITLNPGFNSKVGSEFSAYIVSEYCNGNSFIQNRTQNSSEDQNSIIENIDSTINVLQYTDSLLNTGLQELTELTEFQEYLDSLETYRYIDLEKYSSNFECSYGKFIRQDEDFTNEFLIYPNPNIGNFQILFTSEHSSKSRIVVKSILGQNLWKTELNVQKGQNELKFDLSHLPSGIYNFIFQTDERIYKQKLTIQK